MFLGKIPIILAKRYSPERRFLTLEKTVKKNQIRTGGSFRVAGDDREN